MWTPCAGPILAAVSALSAERRISLELVAITLAYAAGATLPLFALALLGQRAAGQLARVRSGGAAVRRVSGAVLVAAAFLFTTDIPTQLAVSAPGYVSAIQGVERAHSIAGDLRHLTASAANSPAAVAAGQLARHAAQLRPGAGLHRDHEVAQHARVAAALAARPARARSCWSTSGRTRA